MQRATAWLTVAAQSSTDLDRKINFLLKEGWQPYGQTYTVQGEQFASAVMFYQACVRLEDEQPTT